MDIEKLWVGTPKNGSKRLYVFDENMQHEDFSMVNLFCVHSCSMKPYEKEFVRSALAASSKRSAAIASYSKWHNKSGDNFLVLDRERQIRAQEEKRNKVIQKHKEFIENLGVTYQGIKLTDAADKRITHCYSCKKGLDSEVDIQCALCKWLICSCGACGCGFKK